MVLRLPCAEKRVFWVFEKSIFQFFENFWEAKLKPFLGKVRQSVQNYLNQNLVIGSFLESGFQASWSSKANLARLWKGHFSDFRKLLSGEVETIFVESEAKRSKLFKSKFGHRKLLCLFGSILENASQFLFDRSRQSLLEFLNIFNVLNIFIWIFNWSY